MKLLRQLLIIGAMVAAPSISNAQTPAQNDALTSCVVRSATQADSVVLMRWLFIAISRHPDLPQNVRVGDAEGLAANRDMGALVNRMLFEACEAETRAAVAANGPEAAVEAVFGTLGEKAMTDLMGNSDVMASVIQLGAYIDRTRFEALMATGNENRR